MGSCSSHSRGLNCRATEPPSHRVDELLLLPLFAANGNKLTHSRTCCQQKSRQPTFTPLHIHTHVCRIGCLLLKKRWGKVWKHFWFIKNLKSSKCFQTHTDRLIELCALCSVSSFYGIGELPTRFIPPVSANFQLHTFRRIWIKRPSRVNVNLELKGLKVLIEMLMNSTVGVIKR